MAYLRRCVSVLLTLSLLLSVGVLAPPSSGGISAAEIEVSSGESIQDAIDGAAPGDVIIVGPGTYTEGLVIDKSLTLRSSDGADATTIVGLIDVDLLDSETLVLGGDGVGFTITNPGGPGIDARLDYWSTLTVEGNVITGSDTVGLRFYHVHYFSEAVVRGNEITENGECGIEVGTSGQAVKYHSTVSILDNVITGNDHEGIDWDDTFSNSHGLIQGNTITGNGDDGIWHDDVEHGSSLDILDNVVSDNAGRGIFIYEYEDGCEGLIQGNTIERNAEDGLYMSDDPSHGSRLIVRDNTVVQNGGYGLRFDEVEYGGHLAVNENEISENASGGIRVYDFEYGAEGLIDGNSITGNGGYGICVYSGLDYGSSLVIEGNDISGTRSAVVTGEAPDGWSVEYWLDHDHVVPGSETVYVNDVETSAYTLDTLSGTIVFDAAPGGTVTVDYSYGGAGIFVGDEVGEGSDLAIRDNTVVDSGTEGILVEEIERGAEVVISEGNTISRNGAHGVTVGSRYYDSWSEVWYTYGVEDGSLLEVAGNDISNNGGNGVDVLKIEEGSRVLIEENALSENAYGVYVTEMTYGSMLDIIDNAITGHSEGGIHAGDTVDESAVNVLNNVITGNGGTGLDISGGDGLDRGAAVIRCNTIADNYVWGIDLYVDDALVDISGNDISENGNSSGDGGIRIDGEQIDFVDVHQNTIEGNLEYGLLNLSGETLDATHNWWGDADGPYQATTNPAAGGDEVSDNVDYADWLGRAPALCALYESAAADTATITVGDGGEDCATIQAAIDAAEQGDTILVSPGTYSEDLTIEKSLTVQSTGGADVTTVDGNIFIDLEQGETARFGGDGTGFTVTGGSAGFWAEASSWSQLTIEGNVISDCDGDGIYVDHVRRWSVLSVLGNEISDNSEDGIDVLRIEYFGEMLIEGNAITENARGVNVEVVRYCSTLEMRDNAIEDNAGTGINLSTSGHSMNYGSSLVLVDNEIRSNGFDGECNGGRGFYCDGLFNGSDVTVQGNTITGNASDGFYLDRLEHGCSLDIVDNLATENGRRGITVNEYWDGCEGLIQGNAISHNAMDGIFIHNDVTTGSQLTVRDNEILANGGMGFRVDEVKEGGSLSVVDNRIEDNAAMGIYLYEMDSGGDCGIDGNSIVGNVEYGIYVPDGADLGAVLTITGNTIADTGVEVTGAYVGVGCGGETYFYPPHAPYYDNHGGYVADSVKVYLDGVEVPASDYDFESYFGITFDTAPGDGVLVTADFTLEVGGWGIYVNNDVDEGAEIVIQANQISDNLQSGIFIRDIGAQGAAAVIGEANLVSGNGAHGIEIGRDEYGVRNGSSLTIADNEVVGNVENGIHLHKIESGSVAHTDANIVTDNGGAALWLCGEAQTLRDSEAYVLGNSFDANDGWGIYGYLEHALLDISNCNKVTDNAGGGIYLDGEDLDMVGIHNNNIEGNTEWGLLNESGETVDALSNWWGVVSGPYHPDSNAVGLGDPVSDDVTFQPWLLSACDPSGISAGFKASGRTGNPGMAVRFTDTSSSNCEIVAWLWDFGDGSASTEQNPTHVYNRAGIFTVTLTVRDACGYFASATMKGYVTVEKEAKDDVPEPANLGVSYLYVDPLQVLPGQAVTVSANVCNRGEERGTRTASFMVNGEAVESQSVSVSGGACQQVTFTVARAVPGTYQVAIDGMTGQFSVVAPRTVTQSVPSQQQNGLGTAGIIAIIAVMLVLIAALIMVFRRT